MSQLGNLSPEGSVAVGVIVCLLSSGIQSLGLTLQRKSHMLEETEYFDSPRPPYRRRRWQVGFSLFLIANLVGSTIQLSILPLPVLAALQAAGLVFNSINATWILGEDFTRWSFAGTILVSGGAVLIAYFGALPEPAHSLNQLLALFARKQFIAWAVVQFLLISAVFGVIFLLRRVSASRGRSKKMRLARGMCYGALSGMLSAHSLLMAKSAVELLVRTVADGENQFAHWQSWIILIALIAIGLSQLYCLHSGLELCSTSVLYPFVFCVYNVITILDGLIYFNQGSQLSNLDTGLIILGTFILLSGVFCLSWRLAAEDVSGPQSSETSENLLTPSAGVIRTPTSPMNDRRSGETQPLLSRSPRGGDLDEPFAFRPARVPTVGRDRARDDSDGDEEAMVGLNAGPASSNDGRMNNRLDKTRKRATFAGFGTMDDQIGRARASTNPTRQSLRRPSLLSQYARTKSRKVSLADSHALWGELEESGNPPGGSMMARSEPFDGNLSRSQVIDKRTIRWRRMSEGSGLLLGDVGARLRPTERVRRASDAGNNGKHGDPGEAVDDNDEDDDGGEEDHMASSLPLLQRADTGRKYRVISPQARRRRSSVPEGSRLGPEERRELAEEDRSGRTWTWHTIDSSHGRPDDHEAEGGNSGILDWRSWRRWLFRKDGSRT